MHSDQFGNPLRIGDPIIYVRKGNYDFHHGTVAGLLSGNYITVRNNDTGRVSVNSRNGKDVINVKPLLDSHPEYFV